MPPAVCYNEKNELQVIPMNQYHIRRIIFLALALLAAAALGAMLILPLAASTRSPSVGIIGGANGPTVILFAGQTWLGWAICAAIVLLTIGIIGFVLTGRKQ